MATVTQQEVAPLHKQLNITVNKEDYLPQFEKSLKEYSKKANIPGFRKGMVPSGLIKKMYGPSLFTDEVLRTVDKEVFRFIEDEKLEIFAQPLPVSFDLSQLDVNNPVNYTFSFEVGMKPEFQLPDLAQANLDRYIVEVTDEMLKEETERIQSRYGNMTDAETVNHANNILTLNFTELNEEGQPKDGGVTKENSLPLTYFKESYRSNIMGKKAGEELTLSLDEALEDKEKQWVLQDLALDSATGKTFKVEIRKIGLVEPRELNEELFTQLFPNQEIKTEEEFKNKLKEELQKQWDSESRNQMQHTIYHHLLDNTSIDFPSDFLKRWLKTQAKEGEVKTDEELEKEFPAFVSQLKWSLITEQMVKENSIEVQQQDIRDFAKQQLFGYMGMAQLDEEQQWVSEYIDKMMKDRKFVEDSYNRIQTQKIFEWAETKINAKDHIVSKEAFIKMNEKHQHEQHS